MEARIEPAGVVRLPEQLWSFFQEDDECEVAQFRTELVLRRRWHPRSTLSQAGDRRDLHREAFRRAAGRHLQGLALVARDIPELALYLAGYVVECRLKFLICQTQQAEYLDEAAVGLSARGLPAYELTGHDGHRLDLLWRLAGLQRDLSRKDLEQTARIAFSWSVGWRYNVPADIRRNAGVVLAALRRLAGVVEDRIR